MKTLSKQDRQNVRTAAELEQKYNLGSIVKKMSTQAGDIAEINMTLGKIGARVADAEGDIGRLELTSEHFKSQIEDVEDNISELTQTATSLKIRIGEAEDNISSLKVSSKGTDMDTTWASGSVTCRLVSFIGEEGGKGVWSAKYYEDGTLKSGLYFDYDNSVYKFSGSINVSDNFIVDKYGNVSLNGSITWGTGSSPTQVVYATSELTKPSNGTSYDSFASSGSSVWHKTCSSSDYYASYTYDGGATWTSAIQIRGRNGSNGSDGEDGKDGSDATVNYTNVFNALTNNGTSYGCFTASNGYLYINAAYINTGYLSADRISSGTLTSSVISVPNSYTISSNQSSGTTIDGAHLAICLSGVGTGVFPGGIYYVDGTSKTLAFGVTSSGFALYNSGILRGTIDIQTIGGTSIGYIGTVTVNSSNYGYLNGSWYTNGMFGVGTSTTSARLLLYNNTALFKYSSTTVASISWTSSGAELEGTWSTEEDLTVGGKVSIGSSNGPYISATTISTVTCGYLYGTWCIDDILNMGTSTTAARLLLNKSSVYWYYGNTVQGRMTVGSSNVSIYGTWNVNSSATWTDSSDRKLKNTISEFSDEYDVLFDNLIPRTFKWNDGTSGRTHSGFVVQEVVDAIKAAGMTTQDLAAVVAFGDQEDEETMWGMRYIEMISLNTWQIQKLKARVAALEEIIKNLEVTA